MQSLADALHPQHGTIVVNMHCGPRPRLGENLLRQLRGLPPLTFDEGSPEAAAVLRYAGALKCALPALTRRSARPALLSSCGCDLPAGSRGARPITAASAQSCRKTAWLGCAAIRLTCTQPCRLHEVRHAGGRSWMM